MKTCRQCSNPIIGRTKRAAFCSYDCKEAWHLEAAKRATDLKLAGRSCVVCGTGLTTRSGKAQCCSKTCSVTWQNRKRAALSAERWEARKKPCPQCGKEIPTDRRAGVVYCSLACKKREMDARWRERSPGYMRRYLYGLTPEQHTALLEKQDGRCAICRTDTPGGKGGWHVDHDHDTKAIRGLLCNGCNLGLGHFADDATRLRAAIAYLGT